MRAGSRGRVAAESLFAEKPILQVRFDTARVYAELLFLGGGLGRGISVGLRHLVQFGANALVGIEEKTVLAAEVAADDAAGIDEYHVRHHQRAVRPIVPLQVLLHGVIVGVAGSEIRLEGLEDYLG